MFLKTISSFPGKHILWAITVIIFTQWNETLTNKNKERIMIQLLQQTNANTFTQKLLSRNMYLAKPDQYIVFHINALRYQNLDLIKSPAEEIRKVYWISRAFPSPLALFFFHLLQFSSDETILYCQKPSYIMTIMQVVGTIPVYDKQLINICKTVNPIASNLEAEFEQTLQGKSRQPTKTAQSSSSRLNKQMYRNYLAKRLPEKCLSCIPDASDWSGFYKQSTSSPYLSFSQKWLNFFLIIQFQGQSVTILGIMNIF